MKEVQQFLGLANYYRRFIQNFATIAKPLHKLTESSTLPIESIIPHNLLIMRFGISQIFCLLCTFLCFLDMHYADNLYL